MSELMLDLSRLTAPQRTALEQEAREQGCSLEDAARMLIEEQTEQRCRIPALRHTVVPFRRRHE